MLVIRKSQMEVFEQAADKNFEDGLLKHLQEFFHRDCEILGEKRVRQVIRYGIERAEKYGIVSERGLYLYLDLMFILGSHFEQDPQYPWAAEILADQAIADPTVRAERLYDRAMEYLDQVMGLKNEHLERALLKWRNQPFQTLAQNPGQSFGERLMYQLYALFPEKYKAMGDGPMRQFIRQGYNAAKQYHITDEQGVAVFIGLMLILGSGFDTDPQYPWATEVLKENARADPLKKGNSLHRRSKAYFESW